MGAATTQRGASLRSEGGWRSLIFFSLPPIHSAPLLREMGSPRAQVRRAPAARTPRTWLSFKKKGEAEFLREDMRVSLCVLGGQCVPLCI